MMWAIYIIDIHVRRFTELFFACFGGVLFLTVVGYAQDIGYIAKGDGFRFSNPIDCSVDRGCEIIQFVDVEGGTLARDFRCGSRSENGNTSTDFGILDIARVWADPVAVLASADGVVVNRRDGISDVALVFGGEKPDSNLERGNYIELDHGDGWRTIYGHLQNGSVHVEPGKFVKRGDVIGFVGLSGLTVYPHLRFELLHGGRFIDPYSFKSMESTCVDGVAGRASLMDETAHDAFPYAPSTLIASGFSSREGLSVLSALNGSLAVSYLDVGDQFVGLFGLVGGVERGDIWQVEIIGPQGNIVLEETGTVVQSSVMELLGTGVAYTDNAYPDMGMYKGRFSLRRTQADGNLVSIVQYVSDIEMKR